MHDASPEARALAGLAADLFDFALFALLGFAFVNAYAPRQDLPWKPLSISEPLGLATTAKLERTVAGPAQCLAFLRRESVAFLPAADADDGGFCVVRDAVLMGPQGARLSPAAPLMACPLAAAFAVWSRQVVQPAAGELLGQPVAEIDHFGSYSCRRIYGQAEGTPSEHARADAVDVAGFLAFGVHARARMGDLARVEVELRKVGGEVGGPGEQGQLLWTPRGGNSGRPLVGVGGEP